MQIKKLKRNLKKKEIKEVPMKTKTNSNLTFQSFNTKRLNKIKQVPKIIRIKKEPMEDEFENSEDSGINIDEPFLPKCPKFKQRLSKAKNQKESQLQLKKSIKNAFRYDKKLSMIVKVELPKLKLAKDQILKHRLLNVKKEIKEETLDTEWNLNLDFESFNIKKEIKQENKFKNSSNRKNFFYDSDSSCDDFEDNKKYSKIHSVFKKEPMEDFYKSEDDDIPDFEYLENNKESQSEFPIWFLNGNIPDLDSDTKHQNIATTKKQVHEKPR